MGEGKDSGRGCCWIARRRKGWGSLASVTSDRNRFDLMLSSSRSGDFWVRLASSPSMSAFGEKDEQGVGIRSTHEMRMAG